MPDFDLSKITGREPPLKTPEELLLECDELAADRERLDWIEDLLKKPAKIHTSVDDNLNFYISIDNPTRLISVGSNFREALDMAIRLEAKR